MMQYPTPSPGVFWNHDVTAKSPPKYRFQRAYRQNPGNKDLIERMAWKSRTAGSCRRSYSAISIISYRLTLSRDKLRMKGPRASPTETEHAADILRKCHPERSEGPVVPVSEETAEAAPAPPNP